VNFDWAICHMICGCWMGRPTWPSDAYMYIDNPQKKTEVLAKGIKRQDFGRGMAMIEFDSVKTHQKWELQMRDHGFDETVDELKMKVKTNSGGIGLFFKTFLPQDDRVDELQQKIEFYGPKDWMERMSDSDFCRFQLAQEDWQRVK